MFVWWQCICWGVSLALRRLKELLFGYKTVESVALVNETVDMVDITVEPSHEFLVKCGSSWMRTHNCIIDDPISEQDAITGMNNPEIHDRVYEWYTSGPRQRLQPGGSIIIIQTRWSKKDLTGQVLKSAALRDSDEWHVVEFPALLPSGNALWPEFWPLEEVLKLRDELPNHQWMAQYQQDPVSESAAIVKREWWQWWDGTQPPKCEFIIQSWDTAHETKTMSDYSACTTWGVFINEKDEQANIILLNSFKDRLEFPDLKRVAYQEWKDWEPDAFLVEKKAAGAPLIQEFRAMGIPVTEFSPGKGQDKISRLNAVSDIIASGKVWVPRTRWAEELVDEIASFPAGEHDDLCLIAGTEILMGDGTIKPIEDIREGELVMSHLGPQRAIASGNTNLTDTYTVMTDQGVLTGTGAHPVFTLGGWKRIDELNRNDTIVAVSTYGELLWHSQGRVPLCGTDRKKGELGIGNTRNIPCRSQIEKLSSRAGNLLRKIALSVGRCLKRLTMQDMKFALQNAIGNDIETSLETKNCRSVENASSAELSSFRCKHEENSAVTGAKVLSVEKTGRREPVYNLTVEYAHTYFANGFLTHNCDSATLALSRFRQGGFVNLPSDYKEPEPLFKSSRRNRYY